MPPSVRVQPNDLVQAAIRIVRSRGIDALTAKELAKEAGCSTQPIFWHFRNMDDIRAHVTDYARGLFRQYLHAAPGPESDGRVYKAIGWNYIRFASEETQLFRMLFMSKQDADCDLLHTDSNLPYILDVLVRDEQVERETANRIMTEMWLFAHGIATMIATDTARFTPAEIGSMLTDVYRGLLLHADSTNAPKGGAI